VADEKIDFSLLQMYPGVCLLRLSDGDHQFQQLVVFE